VGLNHPPRNRQSEAGTRATLIEACEPFEDSLAIGRRDPFALIGDAHADLAFTDPGLRGHHTPGTRVRDGVVQQVREQLPQTVVIAIKGHVGIPGCRDPHTALSSDDTQLPNAV
jgi:hypothetical protein